MESDGTNPVRLTTGSGEKFPHCSPDGKWVIYNSVGSDESLYSLWKVPLEGGQPVWIADQTNRAVVSPDGKHIAYCTRSGICISQQDHRHPILGGQPEGTFELPPDTPVPEVHWAADSRALLYASMRRGVSDIWVQALDGTPARQLTNLKFEGRLLFDLSPDGKQLVLTRRLWTFDVLLLTTSH
jgi:Tol biopolymer transport system component